MAKINQKIERLYAGTDSVFVIHRTGKTGISVFVRARKQGQQSTIGARNVFSLKETTAAEKKYQERISEAKGLGYVPRAVAGGPAATKFDAIPAPGHLPDGLPVKGSKTTPAQTTAKATPKTGLKAVTRAVAR